MRRLTASLALSVLFSCSQKQELANDLVNKHWFVQASQWEEQRRGTFTTDSISAYDWEAIFYKDGRMLYASTYPVNFTDDKGVKFLKGQRFVDTAYRYELKNNIVKVSKEDETYYLEFLPLENNTFIITPSDGEDFN